jgi:8-oxo-dGTP pyrophosphatase MutT (NUDIX family)
MNNNEDTTYSSHSLHDEQDDTSPASYNEKHKEELIEMSRQGFYKQTYSHSMPLLMPTYANSKQNIGGNSNYSLITCNNCGKQGHMFHQCKLPITSYGIITCRSSVRGIEFLMIRRKDSFGYIDFIRGKYTPYNLEQLQNTINEMSLQEKTKILTEPFEILWREMWGDSAMLSTQYRSEEITSSKKFNLIRHGISVGGDKIVKLQDLVESSPSTWTETEWEFPKGRRNNQEKDLECALREFQEETGYSSSDISIIENILPFEEIYIGSNHKSYKHKYFVGYMNENIDKLQDYQRSEVSKLEWKTIDECLASIRPYNLEKKKIICNIYELLQQYKLYQ